MSQPYVGEIRMFAGNFAPAGWMFCEGQLLPISEYETLFVLITTTYGGDGETTFGLPDLRGRVPVHQSSNIPLASMFGTETETLITSQIPAHSHAFLVYDATANSPNPGNNQLGLSTQAELFYGDNPGTMMNAGAISPIGGSQPHENMMPFLCISFIISMFGIFPTQN